MLLQGTIDRRPRGVQIPAGSEEQGATPTSRGDRPRSIERSCLCLESGKQPFRAIEVTRSGQRLDLVGSTRDHTWFGDVRVFEELDRRGEPLVSTCGVPEGELEEPEYGSVAVRVEEVLISQTSAKAIQRR